MPICALRYPFLHRSIIYSAAAYHDSRDTIEGPQEWAMYRSASPPLFGIPDYPPLRRVKPLPKRRRTSLDVHPHTSVNLKTSSLLSHTSTKPYVDSIYPPPSHVSGQNLGQTQPYRLPGSSGPSQSMQDPEFDWEPFLGLPEDALRVAYDLPMRGSLEINGERSGDVGDTSGGKQLLLPGHDLPQLIGSDSLPVAVTPPPSSDASTDEDSDSQARNEALKRLSLIPRHPPLTPEDSNGEEDPESEGTEGDLQERLFSSTDADRLLAQADPLSTKMALHSYYHSMGLGISEFETNTDAARLDHVATGYTPQLSDTTIPLESGMPGHGVNLAAGGSYVAVGVGRNQDEETMDGRGDYIDHSSQQSQGNTKKRKVPANVGNSPPHHHHHHHHHVHHYPSYRNALGAYGYGENGRAEDEEGEREYNFGFGFGMDLGGGNLAVAGSERGVESDVFGPLSGAVGGYQDISADDAILPPRHFHRKAKLSPATLAGLQRKELIRKRKKQLEAIMGPLSIGNNSWTLDHALSTSFPSLLSISSSSSPSNSPTTDSDPGHPFRTDTYLGAAGDKGDGNDEELDIGWGRGEDRQKEVKVRLSRREKMRAARAAALGLGRLGRHPDAAPFPAGGFTFAVPSTISDRLVAIQEEVANLRNLFGAELARQSARSAKANKGTPGKTGKKRAQQRARTIKSAKSGEQPAEFLEMPQKSGDDPSRQQSQQQPLAASAQNANQDLVPKKGKKKKKRSTLANASNPHHLRNYVPSRLPHAVGGGGSTGGSHGPGNQAMSAGSLWPLAMKFLSAELPPRRRKGVSGGGQNGNHVQPLPQLVFPQEEWVCMFCEYKLFYGDEAKFRLAVRNRKKILRRRRRARERAAAAASGVNAAMKNAPVPAPAAEATQVEDEEYDGPGYESVPPAAADARVDGTRRTRLREPGG